MYYFIVKALYMNVYSYGSIKYIFILILILCQKVELYVSSQIVNQSPVILLISTDALLKIQLDNLVS